MSLEFVFTENGTVEHGSGSPISGGVFTVVSPPDPKVSVDSSKVHFGILSFSFAGGNAAGYDPGTITGGGTVTPTATQVKNPAGFILREGDTGTLTASGTVSGVPTPISGPVQLGSAGQTKVSAE